MVALMMAILLFVACAQESATPIPTQQSATPGDVQMVKLPAPIESIEIHIAESDPEQYFVGIVSGLPSGCAEFDSHEETRSGDTITITVSNREPAPGSLIACTADYRYHELNVPLGIEFESGVEYTVNVNDMSTTFTGQ